MTTSRRRRFRDASLAATALAALSVFSGGCETTPTDIETHWNVDSVPRRVTKAFTGYRGPLDGSYLEHQARKKQHINMTLRRHFLNNNPASPFQVPNPYSPPPRRPHSILPDPLFWFHLESLAFGGLLLGWTGAFIPLPFDSVLAFFSEDGRKEFWEGIEDTFDGVDEVEPADPPPPRKFRVRNR